MDRKTCGMKMASQGGSLSKHASLSVANRTLNLLRSMWSSFSFPFWSYSRQTSFQAASLDLSVSQSARMNKSLKFSGLSLSTLKTVRLPIPNMDDVESHPVMAWNLQRWSLWLPRVILYTWRGGHSYDIKCYPCKQNVRWKWNQRSDHC
jgi:hypothetical protein